MILQRGQEGRPEAAAETVAQIGGGAEHRRFGPVDEPAQDRAAGEPHRLEHIDDAEHLGRAVAGAEVGPRERIAGDVERSEIMLQRRGADAMWPVGENAVDAVALQSRLERKQRLGLAAQEGGVVVGLPEIEPADGSVQVNVGMAGGAADHVLDRAASSTSCTCAFACHRWLT